MNESSILPGSKIGKRSKPIFPKKLRLINIDELADFSKTNPSYLFILIRLYEKSDKNNEVLIKSITSFGIELGLSKPTILKAFNIFINKGYIKKLIYGTYMINPNILSPYGNKYHIAKLKEYFDNYENTYSLGKGINLKDYMNSLRKNNSMQNIKTSGEIDEN